MDQIIKIMSQTSKMPNLKKPKPTPVGGEMIPHRPRVNSLQALMRLKPLRGCEWNVIAFVLNRDMIQPDGTLDDLHAVVFCLGSFSSQKKAEAHAKKIIELTGHNFIVTVQYGLPLRLATKFDPASVVEVPVDLRGRLLQMEDKKEKEERAEFERRLKIERAIVQEAEDEVDPDHIEHFKRQAFLAVKNRAAYHTHQKQADAAWENYKKREAAVRDHFKRFPDHEAEFLPYLKTKLSERGEMLLYAAIETGYKDLRNELLGLEPIPAPSVPVVEPPLEDPVIISPEELVSAISPTETETAGTPSEIEAAIPPTEIKATIPTIEIETASPPTETETAIPPAEIETAGTLSEIEVAGATNEIGPSGASSNEVLSDQELMIDSTEVSNLSIDQIEECEEGFCRISSDIDSESDKLDPGFVTETLSDSETTEVSEIQSAPPAPSAPHIQLPPEPVSLEIPEISSIGLISSNSTKRNRRGRR